MSLLKDIACGALCAAFMLGVAYWRYTEAHEVLDGPAAHPACECLLLVE